SHCSHYHRPCSYYRAQPPVSWRVCQINSYATLRIGYVRPTPHSPYPDYRLDCSTQDSPWAASAALFPGWSPLRQPCFDFGIWAIHKNLFLMKHTMSKMPIHFGILATRGPGPTTPMMHSPQAN